MQAVQEFGTGIHILSTDNNVTLKAHLGKCVKGSRSYVYQIQLNVKLGEAWTYTMQ